MKKINSLLGGIILVLAVISCDETTVSTYELSNEIKSLGGYEVGTQWVYDVEIDSIFFLTYNVLIRDTIVKGDITYRYDIGEGRYKEPETFTANVYPSLGTSDKDRLLSQRRGIAKENHKVFGRGIKTDTVLIDSVFILGQYHKFNLDTALTDTFRIIEIRDWHEKKDDGELEEMDSVIVVAQQVVYSTDSLHFTDTITVVENIVEYNQFMMNGNETNEQMIRTRFNSTLNPNESEFEIFNASSNGSETYARDLTTVKSDYYNAYTVNFINGEPNQKPIDNTRESNGLGTYEFNLILDTTINNIYCDSIFQIRSRYEIKDNEGFTQTVDMEYYLKPKGGIVKKQDHRYNTTWTLKK